MNDGQGAPLPGARPAKAHATTRPDPEDGQVQALRDKIHAIREGRLDLARRIDA